MGVQVPPGALRATSSMGELPVHTRRTEVRFPRRPRWLYLNDRGPGREPGACRFKSGQPPQGRLPKWSTGAVCKTVGNAFLGSNPRPATMRS